MNDSLDKFVIHEKIQESWERHGGDLLKVQRETKYDLGYIRRVTDCLKLKFDGYRDAVAWNIYKNITFYHRANLRQYNDILGRMMGRDQLDVSMCCDSPVKATAPGQKDKQQEEITEKVFCLLCRKGCYTKVWDRPMIAELELKICKQRLDEFLAIIDAATKLGFVAKAGEALPVAPPPGGFTAYKPNVLIVTDKSGDRKEIFQEFGQLDPMDAERVIKKLEYRLLDDEQLKEKLNGNKSGKPGQPTEETTDKG